MPLADRLGGEEGVEDAIQYIRGDAAAVVDHFYPHFIALRLVLRMMIQAAPFADAHAGGKLTIRFMKT